MEFPSSSLSTVDFLSLIEGDLPVLADFYATWCEPCKYLDVILTELESSTGDKVRIMKLDIDEQGELARHFHIMSVPTLMIFKSGELKWRMAGFKLAHELEEDLKAFM